MKKLLIIIFSMFIVGGVFSQSYNNIYGKQDFKDSLKFSKYKSPLSSDSVFSVDGTTGALKLVKRGVDSATMVMKGE